MSKNIGILLYNVLKDDAAVAAIVSDRITPIVIGLKSTYPAITYQSISTVPTTTKSGPIVSSYDIKRYQINVYSDTALECENLAQAVRTALDGLTPGLQHGITVKGCYYQSERDIHNPKADVGGIYSKAIDFKIHIS